MTTETPAADLPFAAKTVTRATGTFLAIATPDEFFADPRHLVKLAKVVGGRFASRQRFYDRQDAAQDAAVVALRARSTWTPDRGVPFGGFAYRSAILWCTGAMYKASIPVCGPESRAEVESVRYSSLDAPRGASAELGSATFGEMLSEDRVVGGRSTRPDEGAELAALLAELRGTADDLDDDAFDAVAAVMCGAKLAADEVPEGWTLPSLTALAERLRVEMRRIVGARDAETPADTAPAAAPAYDPWA